MKKSTSSKFFMVGLIAASLFCYTHLQFKANESIGDDLSSNVREIIEAEQHESTDIAVPDVSLVKRLLNITKIVLPKD